MKTAVETLGINSSYLTLIKIIYNKTIAKRKQPESISIKLGIKQGFPFSPLFI